MKSAEITVAKGVTDQPFARTPDTKSPYPQIRIRACVPQERQTLRQELVYTVLQGRYRLRNWRPIFKFAFYERKAHTGSQNIVD